MFPRTCVFCDEILTLTEKTKGLCECCNNKIKFVREPKCKKCGKSLMIEEKEYCNDCMKNEHLYDWGFSAFVYNDLVKKSIYRFKYHNRREYAYCYGKIIADEFYEEISMMNPDVIIPVPIHRKRYMRRGYNQAELLARELSISTGIPMDNKILIRVANTRAQKELSVKERHKNLEKAFKITEDVVKYNKIVIVDDIYTTGSTINACSKVLLENGAKKIYFISLSIGMGV